LAIEADQYKSDKLTQRAARLYEQSFDAYPVASNLSPLRWAMTISKEEGDFTQAVRLYTKGLETSPADIVFLNQRGYLYETQLDKLDLALKDYQASSARNNSWATGRLGYLYLNGKGVPKDLKVAEALLDKAAKAGDQRAIVELQSLRKQVKSASPIASGAASSPETGTGALKY
jgi:TPR repeat protein